MQSLAGFTKAQIDNARAGFFSVPFDDQDLATLTTRSVSVRNEGNSYFVARFAMFSAFYPSLATAIAYSPLLEEASPTLGSNTMPSYSGLYGLLYTEQVRYFPQGRELMRHWAGTALKPFPLLTPIMVVPGGTITMELENKLLVSVRARLCLVGERIPV